MAFTVEDFEDLERLLSEHPEWRARLRPLILGDEFMQVPERLNRIDERIAELREETSRRFGKIDEQIGALTADIGTLGREVRELGRQVQTLAEASSAQKASIDRLADRVGKHDGDLLELKYEHNVGSWFYSWLKKSRRVFLDDLDLLDEAVASGLITREELEQLLRLDLIVRGSDRVSGQQRMFAVEVSTTINVEDIQRAADRAALLRRAGYDAVGFVGGYQMSGDAQHLARETGVIIDLHRFRT